MLRMVLCVIAGIAVGYVAAKAIRTVVVKQHHQPAKFTLVKGGVNDTPQ